MIDSFIPDADELQYDEESRVSSISIETEWYYYEGRVEWSRATTPTATATKAGTETTVTAAAATALASPFQIF